MKKQHLYTLVGVIVLAGLGLMTVALPANNVAASTPAPHNEAASIAAEPIIIDHNCTDISKIPEQWLAEAKKLAIHYAHTSHGSQLMSGIAAIESQYPEFSYSSFTAGSSAPTTLDCDAGDLCIYDGNPPETYIEPSDYWASAEGLTRTKSVADTDLFDYSMWSWCGQQSDNTTTTVQSYLNTMAGLESAYPNMRFILMTGHTDGGGSTLTRNNDMVRQYATANNMVLFDFADIESYDPAGNYYPNTSDDCAWCSDWCTAHPDDCSNLPSSCAHSHGFNCLQKGNAYWWMMARLAGWDGVAAGESSKSVNVRSANYGDTVTYTVVIEDFGAAPTATVYMSDTLPTGLEYVAGSLAATSGSIDASSAPALHWSGTLTPTPVVTVTYAALVTYGDGSLLTPVTLTNSAIIASPGVDSITRTAELEIQPTIEAPDFSKSYKAVSPGSANYTETVTYTVVIRNDAMPFSNPVLFTDTLSGDLNYVAGSLSASQGTADDASAPTLYWSGELSPTQIVTITYAASVATTETKMISNTAAFVMSPGFLGEPPISTQYSRSTNLFVNSQTIYLPIVLKSAP